MVDRGSSYLCHGLFDTFARYLALLREMLPFAAFGRPSSKMAARACPGAADGSKWPLEPARNHRMLEKRRSSLPQNHSMGATRVPLELPECTTCAARVDPRIAGGLMGASRATPEQQNALRSPFEPALAPHDARKSVARADGPEKWPLEEGCLLFVH